MQHETVPLSEQINVPPAVARLRRRGLILLIAVSIVYLCLALFFAISPNVWFVGDAFDALDHWGRSVWPKLAHDAALLDAKTPLRGTKYVIFMLCCLVAAIIACATTLPVNWRLITLPNNRMTYPIAKGIWSVLLGVLLLGFVVFLEQWMIGSKARAARGITNTFQLWIWMALLWWSFSMLVVALTMVVAQLWKHGWPEGKWEYLLRKSREQKKQDPSI